MTQAPPASPLHVVLTPMRLVEAMPLDYQTRTDLAAIQTQMGAGLTLYPGDPGLLSARLTRQTEQPETRLLLHPGEVSELVVQIQNQGDRPLQTQVRVDGDFPSRWCQIENRENLRLSPNTQQTTTLRFLPPLDFFEQPSTLAIEPSQPLDFTCRIWVSYTAVSEEIGVLAPSIADSSLSEISIADASVLDASIADASIADPNATTASGLTSPQSQPQSRNFAATAYSCLLHLRPRSLYATFLPAIYGESDFTRRLLAIFEQAFEPTVQTLDAMWAHLDPLTTPQALLPFLAYWVGCPVNQRWSAIKQRQLIRNAMELYRWRGTRRGLRLYLHLYTDLPLEDEIANEADKHISITELASGGFVLDNSLLGDGAMLGGGKPYHFSVRLRQQVPDQVDEDLVRQIINREKPAFCTYDLAIAAPVT